MNDIAECYDGGRSLPWHESEFIRVGALRLVYDTSQRNEITAVHMPGGETLSLRDLVKRHGKLAVRLPMRIRNSHGNN